MQGAYQTQGDPAELRKAWRVLKGEGAVRARDAARSLGVSEAELVASGCGDDAVRLAGDFRQLIGRMPQVGRVMALTPATKAACTSAWAATKTSARTAT